MRYLKDFEIFENNTDIEYASILFTDVVGSSKLWLDDPNKMEKEIDKHFELMNNIASDNNGYIVKTIGDAFMLYFEPGNSLINAIKSGINIIKEESLDLRVGISCGDMIEKTYNIQNVDLKDFFGNTINAASRMESKVSDPGGLSFCYFGYISKKESEDIKKLIDIYDHSKIEFSTKCDSKEIDEMRGKRSARLLSDIQINSCKNINKLKGVSELTAFKISINK